MAKTKSIQFLPSVFRTDTNRKFLNATIDQLISEPVNNKINGYIGRKVAPSYKNTDNYIIEPDSVRQNYQLEPSIIIQDPISKNIDFSTTYPDILNSIAYYGGNTASHNRLFESEYYSYNPNIDLDKFINFSQYYWLENGPSHVLVTSQNVPLRATYTFLYDAVNEIYKIKELGDLPNPTLTLARGGNYTFVIDSPGNNLYIQSKPGTSGFDPNLPNLSTRAVVGVINNGQDVGSINFTVPLENAQSEWTSKQVVGTVDYATTLSYRTLQGLTVSELNDNYGGIDGTAIDLDYKKIIFVNNDLADDSFWADAPVTLLDGVAYFDNFDIYAFDETSYETTETVPFGKRNDIYVINVINDELGTPRIVLKVETEVNDEQKIRVKSGNQNAGKEFYSRLGLLNQVPYITAPLDTIFYQNSSVSSAAGGIKIVSLASSFIDVDTEILGVRNYISPNGVVFTNGLKILFDNDVSEKYLGKTFYVEGVGSAIKLVSTSELVCPELDNLSSPDYITIKRSSIDKNAWSRSNRWFHKEVIQLTASYNNVDAIFDQSLRAQRPIIEFDENIQLHNFGREAKLPIDILDTSLITDAYTYVQGVTCNTSTSHTFSVTLPATKLRAGRSYSITGLGNTDWAAIGAPIGYTVGTEFTAIGAGTGTGTATDLETLVLESGNRIIFAIDENNQVRNKIYDFEIIEAEQSPSVYKGLLTEAEDTDVSEGHTVSVQTGTNGSKQFYYNGIAWIESQQKTKINQNPLFDVIDENGLSLSDSSAYNATTFTGTKIFSYKEGTGENDSVLGFPLSYKNFSTQGDIQFVNYFDIDEFVYLLDTGLSTSKKINTGLLQKNFSRTTSGRINLWTIANHFSRQYQIYSFIYDGVTNLFSIDNEPDITVTVPNIKVSINNRFIKNENFALSKVEDRYAVLINPDILTVNDAVFIGIYNASRGGINGFYEVPINLDNNTLNTNLVELTLGQIRNHLVTITNNNLLVTGDIPGTSNLRDIVYVNSGGSILQHSAPVLYSGLFLNHPTMNFVNSLRLASKEYSRFKIKFLELAANLELDRSNIRDSVDVIMGVINSVKNSSFPWFYSDMIPHGDADRTILPAYTVINPDITSYEITRIYQDKILSNKSVQVYITRVVNGESTQTLLLKDIDYYFNQDRPAITFLPTFRLLFDDIITIIEYNDTDGSYVPETPTKLGLYPKFKPEKYLDDTYRTPVYVIQGHDGSITPAFNDFRDDLLIELERRIYNNIKTTYDPAIFNLYDYLPGKFRITDYNLEEFNQVLRSGFLTWAGTNKVDYTSNSNFKSSDGFTYNYKNFRDILTGDFLPGYWRSVYKHFYDTDRPHTHPWEMLGFSEKPDYWEERYGPAPYTGGNAVLWSDLSLGYIHAGDRAGFDIRYQRPNLSLIIPVDDAGNLKSPDQVLVSISSFDSSKANSSFAFGDQGPVESAWRRSSEFVFSLHLALALCKPAKYFSLLSNVNYFTRNLITAQFSFVDNNQHISPSFLKVNGHLANDGSTERSAGYINWIRDYIKNLGIDAASAYIKTNLNRINVQLSYRMAGFSDKSYLTILAEQSSPSSINDSVVIPEENYKIEIHKSSPVDKIVYSAVVVEKTVNGYVVIGYNTEDPFFGIIPSQPNNNSYVITVNDQRAVIFQDYKKTRLLVPYGTEFTSTQQVVDFLVSYQRYLIGKGFVFETNSDQLTTKQDFILSVREFLHWADQGWKPGSIITLSPIYNKIQVLNTNLIVDEITNLPYDSKVLDINEKIITKNNFTVLREDNLFTLNVNTNQAIGLISLKLVQYENILILDNQTVFNDVIYLPELGNRQYRLKLVGYKTGEWNGSIELPGALYSTGKIPDWSPGTDYQKGSLVLYKAKYYAALSKVTASDTFQSQYWQNIDKRFIKSGIINNLSTNAKLFENIYDPNEQLPYKNFQNFSNGLIGFRDRDFFNNLGIDKGTQFKFYQGFIKDKGTKNAIDSLKGATFNSLETPINIYENWAVRVGEYGALDVNTFVEVVLDETIIESNPTTIQFSNGSQVNEENIITFNDKSVYRASGKYNSQLFRTQSVDITNTLNPLPVAGYVNQEDVDGTIFNLNDYASLSAQDIGIGYKLWTARNFINSWDILRANGFNGTIVSMAYNIDSLALVTTNVPVNLLVDDLIVIKNFDERFDGLYKVAGINSTTTFFINLTKNQDVLLKEQEIEGTGILLKLSSVKIETPQLLETVKPDRGWLLNDKVWVDDIDGNDNWGVYNKSDPWIYNKQLELTSAQYQTYDHFGSSLATSPDGQILYSSAPDSSNGRVNIFAKDFDNWVSAGSLWGNSNNLDNFGKAIACATDGSSQYLFVGAPDSDSEKGWIYVYKDSLLIQIITAPVLTSGDKFGWSIVASHNGYYFYVGAPGAKKVYCYGKSRSERAENSFELSGDTVNLTYSLPFTVSDSTLAIVNSVQKSLDLVPNLDYNVSQFTNGIKTVIGTYSLTSKRYTISGSTAVDPAPTAEIAYYGIAPTGGTGSGAVINVYRVQGSTQYQVKIINAGSGYTVTNMLTVPGTSLGGASPANDLTITITAVESQSNITFTSPLDLNERISIVQRKDYFELLETLPVGVESSGLNNFGISLATNSDGSTLAVGANTETVQGNSNAGAVYVYHRTVTKFITDGTTITFTPPNPLNSIYRVYLNDVLLNQPDDFYVSGASIFFGPFDVPAAGKILKVETNQFKFDQKITGISVGTNFSFGSKLAMCGSGCNLYVSSPGYQESNYSFGVVDRFINIGRVYGAITGTVENPTVTPGHSFLINDFVISVTSSTLNSVIASINNAKIPGITARSLNNKIVIESSVATEFDKLNLKTLTGTALEDLGLSIYITGQTLKHSNVTGEIFGTSLTVNQAYNILVIGSFGGDITNPISFDNKLTIFDDSTTTFVDFVPDSGSVYIYNLMTNPYESQDSPSLFVLSQELFGPEISENFAFGSSLAITDEYLMIGVPNDNTISTEGGSVYVYYNKGNKSGWDLLRFKEPRVDVNSVNKAFIYNATSQVLLNYFDYIDPAKGKLLGIVDQELDYKEIIDPASYNFANNVDVINNTNFYWSNMHVGKLWWDLSLASFIDYEQGSLTYRTNNWGKLFPDSQVVIYEWVESTVLPSQYVATGGNGIPKYQDNSAYSVVTTVDSTTGVIIEKYYYWVRNKTSVNSLQSNRTLSPVILENYITNPKDQAIPYIAAIAPDALAIYNILDKLSGTNTVLNISTGSQNSQNLIHNEWALIQEGNAQSEIPLRIVTKLKHSLVGSNDRGDPVPNPDLPLYDRIGILTRPRQGMFINRNTALQNFVIQVNNVLYRYPIFYVQPLAANLFSQEEIPSGPFDATADNVTELLYLDSNSFYNGYSVIIPENPDYNGKWTIFTYDAEIKEFKLTTIQSYKTELFWKYKDWYDTEFNFGKDIDFVVDQFGDIQKVTYTVGNYIKVNDNGNGQWLIYEVNNELTLRLVGAQNGTLELLPELYDFTKGPGFDSVVFDAKIFDPQASLEIGKIFDSLYSEIFTNNLKIEFNNLFFNLVNYLFTEQINPDWIFKTSLIDVVHQIRQLSQLPNFIKENTTFYESFINEVKPYRTKIREYFPVYNNLDVFSGSWTDFDIPAVYYDDEQVFRGPDVNLIKDQEYFANEPYINYKENYKYKVTGFTIGNVGVNYTIAPNVEISGGGGSGATAITTINPGTGKLTNVIVTNAGSGYTSTPTVVINGVGSGAIVYPLLKNEYDINNTANSYNLIRNVVTSIKFDRIDYESNITPWSNLAIYSNTVIGGSGSNLYVVSGNIIVYNQEAYIVSNANVTAETNFDYNRYTKLNPGNVLLKAVDRINAYYDPTVDSNSGLPPKDLNNLIYGIEYPGVKVNGPRFRANAFEITSNIISFNYTGLTIDSGNVSIVDFKELGFVVDQPIRIEANVPFNFVNNGVFKIVSVNRDSMMLTGEPIETTYNMLLNSPVNANVGDIITQSNTTGNAFVLANVINSRTVPVIHSSTGFRQTTSVQESNPVYNIVSVGAGENILINGIPTVRNITELSTGGNVEVNLAYLDLFNILDANIYSQYFDSSLGSRPEDINIVGGQYVDQYSSHAPEELVPGRVFDAMEIKVFSNTAANTATYGYRIFQPMSANVEFTRISANNTTTLSSDLLLTDSIIHVSDASVLPDPGPMLAIPGVVFINGEKIHYYQKYDNVKMASAVAWAANTYFNIGSLVSNIDSNTYLVTGNIYANSNVYISSSNIQLVQLNTLAQIRRGVDGTGAANIHYSGNLVSDSSRAQNVPYTNIFYTAVNGTLNVTDYVTYRLELTEEITANAGDYITQFSNANVRILESVSNSKIVAVNLNSQPWRANLVSGSIYKDLDVNSQDTVVQDLFFKPDGTKMYTVGSTNDRVYEYTLSTPWDVTTASNVAAINVASQDSGPTGLFFKPDGTKMYILGISNDRVFEFTLSTPWRVNTASNVGASVSTTSGGTSETSPNALYFKSDGSSYYILGSAADRVKRYDMTTPWQVNTASYYSQSTAITAIETGSQGLVFHPEGQKMFVVGNNNDRIREYDLATAWDPATITLQANSSVLAGSSSTGMYWKPDGTSVFISDSTLNSISEYQVVANITLGNAIAKRVNVVTSGGTTSTTANVLALAPLGTVSSYGTVYVNQTITQSNFEISESYTSLENSTSAAAQFIKAQPSYIP